MLKATKYYKRIYLIFTLAVFCSSLLLSQEIVPIQHLEQLVQSAERLHGETASDRVKEIDPHKGKCGLWLSFEIAETWKYFSESQKAHLQSLLSPQQTQKDTIIGRFHIFYDSTGYDEPSLLDEYSQRIPNTARAYVDSVGKYFNYSWNYLVDTLGYEPPQFKSGDSYYNIYIQELGATYGETVFGITDLFGNFTPPRYTSYIRIENDFKGFYSEGIAGLKVTSAHELHHAFQIGSYGYWSSEIYIYEITSTWMEDVVYNDVNDYYCYLKDSYSPRKGQFLLPDISFTSSDGQVTYSRAIWGKFLEKHFSRDVVRKTWEYMRAEHAIQATDHALTDAGSSFRTAFLEWTIWNNNTGPNCDTVRYYTEGKNYPSMNYRPTIEYVKVPRSFSDTIEVISSVYRPICILDSPSDNCNLNPQVVAIISNLNTGESSGKKVGFSYDISNTGGQGFTKLSNGIFVRLNVPDPQNWVSQESVPTILSDVLVYPNPFYPKGMKPINFRLPPVSQSIASLYIFNSSMDRIAAKDLDVISQNFEPKIEWDGHDIKGDIVPTGVYIYVILIDGISYTGKLAVIKE